MAEGVAEIEQRALAGFALVGSDDLRLDPAALRHRMHERIRVARDEARQIRLEPFEEREAPDRRGLDHFREAR